MFAIRIVDVPSGEAPLEVRQAWVGLLLPLALPSGWYWRSAGVLSGPHSWLTWRLRRLWGRGAKRDGYAVEAPVALRLLEKEHPEAAQWWRANAPHTLWKGRRFIFDAAVCEEVPEAARLD